MAGVDYGDSLRASLDAARKQILDLGQSTAAQRQQAAITLGHSEQALSVAENKQTRNQRDLTIAYAINRVAVQGGALIRSADQLAELGQTSSESASSALAVAATSIRTLASAFDTLAGSIAGVHAVASNDDAGSAMARSAGRSEQATNEADGAVEQLKAASVFASIQSAKSIAASAATSVNAVGAEVQDLVDRSAALAKATQQRVNDSMQQRSAAAMAERAAQMTYRQVKIDAEALDDGTTNLDRVLNGGLTVVAVPVAPAGTPGASGSPPSSPAGAPGNADAAAAPKPPYLEATYTVSGAPTDRCYFFALPASDAPGFSYNDAKTALIDLPTPTAGWIPTPGVRKDPPSGTAPPSDTQTYVATIASSESVLDPSTGKRKTIGIALGQAYWVFAYRVPVEGPYATNASDLSYPSRTTEVKSPIPNLGQYKATVAAAAGADGASPIRLSVQLTAPSDAATNLLERRVFAVLEDVYQSVREDAAFLTGSMPSSSYKRVPASPGTITVDFGEGDTDVYGDIVTAGTNYEVLVMLVPKDTDTMSSAVVVAQAAPTSSGTPSGSPGSGAPSSNAPGGGSRATPASASTSAKPTLEIAVPTAGQPAPGPGAK